MTAQPTTMETPRRSLSPSRAADFKTCPLLYRFRSVDRLPERTTIEQVRGTLVHAVLERLFDLPAERRTPDRAADLLPDEFTRLLAENEAIVDLVEEDPAHRAAIVDSAQGLLTGYFALEDPRRLAPAEREYFIETTIAEDLLLHGYIDRLDVSDAGDVRIVDYKTGSAPREAFEGRALFQLKFYALVVWRLRGVIPRSLRLIYLKDNEICDFSPDAEDLVRFERTLLALRAAIDRATATGDFRPSPSKLCAWCAHHEFCPTQGGVIPPWRPSERPHSVTERQP